MSTMIFIMKMTKSESGKLGAVVSKQSRAENRILLIEKYNSNPSKCKFLDCQHPELSYEKRYNKFCSRSCAASHNNSIKPKRISLSSNKATIKSIRSDRPALVIYQCQNCKQEKEGYRHRPISFCGNICQEQFKRKQKRLEVEAGKAAPGQAKKYLIEKYGNICLDPNCAWDFVKRPINVELEHIDGNSTNNKLENLMLLCPNCHSQTSTYKSKNIGNGRYKRRERYKAGKSY